jgi:membrane-associated phospholipid phosphatase
LILAVTTQALFERKEMSHNLRNWLLTFAATVIAVTVCVIFLDRPVAEFVEQHVRHTLMWIWITRALAPVASVVVVAFVFIFGCGIWLLSGRSLPSWTQKPLLGSWAAMWATAAETILKRILGRGVADPAYIHNHLWGFRFLRGAEPLWASFPSGTATIAAAIASVLWITNRRWRAMSVLAVFLLCAAVVITNYHWLADVIAGAFLGATIGWMTVHLRVPGATS